MNKKAIAGSVLLAILIAACSSQPSSSSVGTAIAQTMTAQAAVVQVVMTTTFTPEPTLIPTNTSLPTKTSTPRPTNTRAPTRTPTPTRDIVQFRQDLASLYALALPKGISDIETVNMVRIANGRFEIEVKTKWASQDRQPIVSRDIIQFFAGSFIPNFSATEAANIADSDKFTLYLVTYSTDGDYRYESTTDYDTLVKVKNMTISYDEWVAASNAGFH
jgi:hypothetical protein